MENHGGLDASIREEKSADKCEERIGTSQTSVDGQIELEIVAIRRRRVAVLGDLFPYDFLPQHQPQRSGSETATQPSRQHAHYKNQQRQQ